uniref:Transposase n=1 Tax=Echinococcus granulosus TaxID=6210 RepID=A0A068WUM5_ECHGR|nr:hypothetical protein EgrG_000168600 [Echinococcus granulosus]
MQIKLISEHVEPKKERNGRGLKKSNSTGFVTTEVRKAVSS